MGSPCVRVKPKRLIRVLLSLCVLLVVVQVVKLYGAEINAGFFSWDLKMRWVGNTSTLLVGSAPARPNATDHLPAPSQTPSRRTGPKYTIPPGFDVAYIGDSYHQDDEGPHRTTGCPNNMSGRMAGTDFQQIYLPKIPLLQWAAHATPGEYHRLRWYNGCFGWNDTGWDVLNATLSLLTTSANAYMFNAWNHIRSSVNPCIRCAVVGNGGILNGSKMGSEIDQHDYVFRVNGAILKGFEADVGTRTSFYGFSTNTMRNSLSAYGHLGFRMLPQSQETSYIFLPDHDRDYLLLKAALTHRPVEQGHDKSIRPSDLFGENYSKEQFKMLHPDFLRYIRNRFLPSNTLKTKNRDIYRPSTGAAMLLAAVHCCDEVSAYGFITPDYQNYSDHYYDKTKEKVHFYLNHDFKMEMDLWQRMHHQGIMKLYSRT